MKMLRVVLLLLPALAISALAQAASRNVVLSWSASPSTSVTGYSIYICTVASGGTSCTPNLTSTPLCTVAGLTCTVLEPTQAAYGFSIVANGPACSMTSSLTVPCGNAPPTTLSYIPVPPTVAGESNMVVVVP